MRGMAVAAPIAVALGIATAGAATAEQSDSRAVAAAVTSVSFTMRGYASLARDVPSFQLGQVYLDGQGLLQQGGSMTGGTTTRNAYLYFPEANMQTQIIGWAYAADPHTGRKELKLDLRVTGSDDPVDCQVGTVGTMTLVDDNRRLSNRQRRDSITQIYPISTCPSFVQGVSNKNAPHLQPTTGGPGGGQWAQVSIAAS